MTIQEVSIAVGAGRPKLLDGASGRSVVPATEHAHASQAWAHAWFALEQVTWSSLAVVPVDITEHALRVASGLAAAGRLYRDGDVELLDARNVPPESTADFVLGLSVQASGGRRAVVALPSPISSPGAIAIVRAVDYAVLVLRLGTTHRDEARRVIEMIGRDHFVGSIVVDGRAPRHSERRRP